MNTTVLFCAVNAVGVKLPPTLIASIAPPATAESVPAPETEPMTARFLSFVESVPDDTTRLPFSVVVAKPELSRNVPVPAMTRE